MPSKNKTTYNIFQLHHKNYNDQVFCAVLCLVCGNIVGFIFSLVFIYRIYLNIYMQYRGQWSCVGSLLSVHFYKISRLWIWTRNATFAMLVIQRILGRETCRCEKNNSPVKALLTAAKQFYSQKNLCNDCFFSKIKLFIKYLLIFQVT